MEGSYACVSNFYQIFGFEPDIGEINEPSGQLIWHSQSYISAYVETEKTDIKPHKLSLFSVCW